MKEENKYYTPEIEELHVGFEYYRFSHLEGRSIKTIMDDFNLHEILNEELEDCCEVISPLRGKELLFNDDEILGTEYANVRLTSKAITTRDRFDVMRTDLIVVNFLGINRVSIGTVLEIGWADMLRKPVLVIMGKGNIHQHGMIKEIAGWVVDDYSLAIKIIRVMAGKELP